MGARAAPSSRPIDKWLPRPHVFSVQSTGSIESGPSDGLYEVVLAAATQGAESESRAVGRIELVTTSADSVVSVEAEFAHQDGRRVIGSLETRVICHLPPGERLALLRDALEQFGGTGLTNLVVTGPERDGMDVTVSFGSRLPFLAENLLLPSNPSTVESSAFEKALTLLGVSHTGSDGALRVPRRQLRKPLTLDQQLAAYGALRGADLSASLYSSRIPCTQAVRIFETGPPNDEAAQLDLTLSRGLSSSYVCTSRDAAEMQNLLSMHLGISFGARQFEFVHSYGRSSASTVRPRRGLEWFARRSVR